MKRRWILKLFNAVAIVLILASVFVLLNVVLTPAGQVPQVLGYSVFRVMTGSMEPEIPEGSLLLVHKTDPNTLEAGDVISFFSPDPTLEGAVNTHRVVRWEEEAGSRRFYTKGDANGMEDSYPVDAAQVVGEVVFVSRGLGRLVTLLSNPLVFGAVILMMNLYRAVKIARDMARQEEEAAVRQALEEIKKKRETGEST